MEKRTVTVKAKTGLHARPASELIKFCKQFKSKIEIVHGTKTGNCGSIISILALGVSSGMEVTLCCEGEDEKKAAEEVAAFIESLVD